MKKITNRKPFLRKVFLFILCLSVLIAALPLAERVLPPGQAQITPSIRTINLVTNDLVYDPVSAKLYASVPSSAGANGNSITVIDPVTGVVGPSVFVGSEPNKLALSDDGKYLYVGLDGAAAVRRFNLKTLSPEIQFSLGSDSFSGPFLATDMAVIPGCADTVLVSRSTSSSSFSGSIGVYDNGVRRGPTASGDNFSGALAFGTSPTTAFVIGSDLRRVTIVKEGLRSLDTTSGLLSGTSTDIKVEGNLIFTPTGRVVDPINKSILGTFSGLSSAIVRPDLAQGKIFFLRPTSDFPSSSNQTYRVIAYNPSTFLPIGSVDIPNINGTPRSLLRFGRDGIAFNVRNTSFSSSGAPQIVLVTSPAVIGSSATLSVVSAASFRPGGTSPDTITSVFGSGLTGLTAAADFLPLPTMLGGTTVKIKDNAGTERLAPLFFVSPGQVNFLTPADSIVGPATITITGSSGTSASVATLINPVSPALFTANADGTGVPAAFALRVSGSGMQTVEDIAQLDSNRKFVPKPIDLGQDFGTNTDKVFLVMFGTGIRGRSGLSNVAARVGCDDATITFAGPQGSFAGEDQINLLIPRSQIGLGELNVVLSVNGIPANPVKINIK